MTCIYLSPGLLIRTIASGGTKPVLRGRYKIFRLHRWILPSSVLLFILPTASTVPPAESRNPMQNYWHFWSRAVNRQMEERFMFGTHSQQLDQMADMLSLKAAIERKAKHCKLRNICSRWKNSPFMPLPVSLHSLALHLATSESSDAGALANGWLGRNCSDLYPACNTFIRLVTEPPPLLPPRQRDPR